MAEHLCDEPWRHIAAARGEWVVVTCPCRRETFWKVGPYDNSAEAKKGAEDINAAQKPRDSAIRGGLEDWI
jgi:hypothetical protein